MDELEPVNVKCARLRSQIATNEMMIAAVGLAKAMYELGVEDGITGEDLKDENE